MNSSSKFSLARTPFPATLIRYLPSAQRGCSNTSLGRKGAYGQIGYRWNNWLIPYARVDWRDALHEAGASFVYISELVRATGGLRFELGTHVTIKAEYTVNRELGRIPQFPNDIFTSSMVATVAPSRAV